MDGRGDAGLADQLGDAVYVVDPDRRITYWNGAAEDLTGYLACDVLGRRCGPALLGHVGEDGTPLCGPRCPLDATIRDGRAREVAALLRTRSGSSLPVHIRAAALREQGDIVGAVEVFRDDTAGWAARRLIEDLQTLVLADPLTGGGNRRALDRGRERAMARFEATGQPFGLIVIDIDDFKSINDQHGHGVGDDVLRHVARRLEACVRGEDVVARL
ncbi:MAG TPA: diguanylate cyclase, partial [Actinotalea sp.]